MIHEFALDPACATDWKVFKSLIGNAGVQYGRLISQFPSNWTDVVFDACNNLPPIKRKTIIDKYLKSRKNIEQKLIDVNRVFIKDLGWRENAVKQHSMVPFHAIISLENPERYENIIIAEDIDEETDLWNVPRGKVIQRKAYDLADCAKMLLNISKDILIIEPNFKPQEMRFLEPLKHFIRFAFENNIPERFELHVEYKNDDKSPDLEWLKKLFIRKLTPIISSKAQVHVLLWRRKEKEKGKGKGDKPHARYVLTERGGIQYDYGLDEGDGQTTDVYLMSHNVYEQRWRDYQKETAAYHLHDHFCVTGSKKT